MSLSSSERAATREDLRRHRQATGLSTLSLSTWTGLPEEEVEEVLAMAPAVNPAHVWLVRDALDAAARNAGVEAGGWSKMTDSARLMAQRWFVLSDLPPQP